MSKVTIKLPCHYHLNSCTAVGYGFSGDVNGTSFAGTLASLKKPNKVSVALS
jgi:hypothetical protein